MSASRETARRALVVAIAVVGAVVLAQTGGSRAVAQEEVDAGCPSRGTDEALAVDPLEGPSAEDTEDEDPPVDPEVEVPAAPAGSRPNQGLKPILRPTGRAPVSAPASADALTPAVELTLRWCVVEKTQGTYDWTRYESSYGEYLTEDVPIRTIRVTDAPRWAVTNNCIDWAATEGVKMCPPTPAHEQGLRDFAAAAAARFGPGSTYGAGRFAFWNEPNLTKNWGVRQEQWKNAPGENPERDAAQRYSDLLAEFHAGATQGNPGITIDAGEIAAGSTQNAGNGVRSWATKFANYNTAQNRNWRYNVLTIHPYSQFGTQIPHKVANYKALPGVQAVGVTEFAWGAGDGGFKCADSEEDQRLKFNNALDLVRGSSVGVHRLAWFSVIDNRKSAGSKCPGAYYDGAVRDKMNTYGLSKRKKNGEIESFSEANPRLLRVAFRNAQS